MRIPGNLGIDRGTLTGVAAALGRRDRGLALGANLIGSLVGGLLQSVTFVTGIRALLLIVAGLYVTAISPDLRVRAASTLIPQGVRDADRLTEQYGGNPGDWAKMGGENGDSGSFILHRQSVVLQTR